ncbi:sigma 54-interacting transcriptional regulator [Desulfobacterales bacterium HSG17]|nr:sigma 54-interacting transcriptional regulator [Desulfobacterales bacterium HSG17]
MTKKLSTHDREFFTLVRAAALANPFSDERVEIDLKVAGLSSSNISTKDRISKLTHEVHTRVNRLAEKDKISINQYAGEDRLIMEAVFLFDYFHQFIEQFDRLIPRQIKAGEKSVRVPFFRDAISYLQDKGFSKDIAIHYFAMSYQLRRAFFFIDHSLVGSSPCMKKLRKSLWNNVFTHNLGLYNEFLWNRMEDFSLMLLGETGTGKGTAAMSVGRSGFIPFDEKKECFVQSFTRSFVSLNLSQFPETLIESELFGHKKGAFTGASEDYKGVFDRCSPYGSIFLDEIGEVSIPIQIKLLQVIQERTFCPVGSHEKRRFEGRVIAATNRPFHKLREQKILRDDFFYRLCSDIIIVPPLRQRIRETAAELNDLLAHTIERILGEPSRELVQMVEKVIFKQPGRQYLWPGNVRELEQCVRRILLKGHYEGDHSPIKNDLNSHLTDAINKGNMDAQRLLSGYCFLLHQQHKTFEAVANITGLDRRTVKKYILQWQEAKE